MNIQLLDLKTQYNEIKEEIKQAIDEVLESQHFILGPKVKKLEEEIGVYSNCKFALGVSSGTDAILLALMTLGVGQGDLVITTPYTFFATAGCIARVGARPVFVDIDPDTYNLSPTALRTLLESMDDLAISKIKAVIPVHLFGQVADMEEIMKVCNQYNLKVIEDAAQAIGAETKFNGKVCRAGSIGNIGCFSFFPSKNLGGYGDGGMVVTNDKNLYELMKILRTHGSYPKYYHRFIGGNFRLDEIQAAVLLVKLKYLDQWSEKRRKNAALYRQLLKDVTDKGIILPVAANEREDVKNFHIYNQFCIKFKNRESLREYLKENGVGTEVYYPVPMHLQECFKYLGYRKGSFINSEEAATTSLALPIYPELDENKIEIVSKLIKDFVLI